MKYFALIAATVLTGCALASAITGEYIVFKGIEQKPILTKAVVMFKNEFCALPKQEQDKIRKELGDELREQGVNIKFTCEVPEVGV
jgi:hypothetical protein